MASTKRINPGLNSRIKSARVLSFYFARPWENGSFAAYRIIKVTSCFIKLIIIVKHIVERNEVAVLV